MTDSKREVRDFLASRRAKISPEQAGLPAFGGHRRVPGLRREEVALLAGVSPDYYTKLERGSLAGASDSVLDAVAHALQLDEAERAHLFDLARAANTTARPRRRPAQQPVRPGLQRILDAMTDARRPCATAAGTSWPPTGSATPSTPTRPAGAGAGARPRLTRGVRLARDRGRG